MLVIRVKRVFDGTRLAPGAGTVFVAEGRIAGIEPANVDIPEGYHVLDRPDATVLSGLIDAHVHLLADSAPSALDRLARYSAADCDLVIEQTVALAFAVPATITAEALGNASADDLCLPSLTRTTVLSQKMVDRQAPTRRGLTDTPDRGSRTCTFQTPDTDGWHRRQRCGRFTSLLGGRAARSGWPG